MAKGLEDFQIQASAVGFDKAADQVNKLNEAKRALGAPDDEAAKGAEKLTETQQKLNASSETYVSLLTRINPMLGVFADSMVKATRVVGDFANAQINIAGVMGKATAAIRANWNALKLFGAGGVLAAAIWAIVHAVTALVDAHKRAEQAAIAHRKAVTDLNRENREMAEQAAFERARMPFRQAPTEAQFRSMRQTIEEAPPEIRQALIPYVAALGGAVGTGPGAGAFRGAELQQMARLQPQIPEGPQQIQVDFIRAWQASEADRRATVTRLDEIIEKLRVEEATAEARGQREGTEALEKLVEPIAKEFGVEVAGFIEKFMRERRWEQAVGTPADVERERQLREMEYIHGMPLATTGGRMREPQQVFSPQEQLIAEDLRRRLQLDAPQTPVVINNHNGRYFWAPVEVMRRAITNGESMGREFE